MAVLTLIALQNKINSYIRVGGVPSKINATQVKELLTDMKDTLAALPETDPVFSASVAGSIITTDLENWYQAFNSVITGMAPRALTGGTDADMLNAFNALFYAELAANLALTISNSIAGASGHMIFKKTIAGDITITFPVGAQSTHPDFTTRVLTITGPANSMHEVGWLHIKDSGLNTFYMVQYSGLFRV
jgi:hypothetical protein